MTRVLGIDYGDVRIGFALSDPMRIIARPLITLRNDNELINEISILVQSNKVTDFVVGYPLGMKGQKTDQTKKVDGFIEVLKNNFSIPITSVDERLSSVSAINSLVKQGIKTGTNKSQIDQTSAAIILQEFLDTNK